MCEAGGSHNGVAEISSLLVYYTLSLVVIDVSTAVQSFKNSAWRNVPEDLNI
jgi:hypothetical protein